MGYMWPFYGGSSLVILRASLALSAEQGEIRRANAGPEVPA